MKKRKIKLNYILPNLFTAASIFVAIISIVSSTAGNYEKGAWLIVMSLFLDGLDGKIARLTKGESKFGVEFEQSGENLLVRAIPEILSIEDIKSIIDGVALESVAAVACRKAIKAGYRPIDFNDLKELFERYLKCQERETCPHGRPIYYRIKKTRIMRKLGRS